MCFSSPVHLAISLKPSSEFSSACASLPALIHMPIEPSKYKMTFPIRRLFSSSLLKKYTKMVLSNPSVEKIIPRKFVSSQQLSGVVPLSNFSPDLESFTEGLAKPIWSMFDRASENWSSTFCLLTGKAFGASYESIIPLAASVEMIHTASLIIDDLEDSSDVRGNLPAVHIFYGPGQTINAGYFLTLLAQAAVREAHVSVEASHRLPRVYIEELLALHLGQCSDMYWNQKKGFMPSYEQYYQMVTSKTAAMVRLAMKLGAIGADVDEGRIRKLSEYAENLGIVLQIKNDLLDLRCLKYAKTRKYIGEDITEGKKTLITIRAVSQSPKAARLLDILAMKSSDLTLVNEALAIIQETDAFQYAEQEADKFLRNAWNVFDEVYPAGEATEDLRSITKYLLDKLS